MLPQNDINKDQAGHEAKRRRVGWAAGQGFRGLGLGGSEFIASGFSALGL